ncbi:hypothetical protein IKG06_01460 [Candidatus Saccharibacteria bacterium]|nr:hypothetical protein [Candidatus Saccharibacteria bacterium]
MRPKNLSLVASPIEHEDGRARHCWTFVLMSLTEAQNIHVYPVEPSYLYDGAFRCRGIVVLTPKQIDDGYLYDLYAIDKKLSPIIHEIVNKLINYASHPSMRKSMYAFADYIRL